MKRVGIALAMLMILFLVGCQQSDTKEKETAQLNDDTKYEEYIYKKYELDVNDKVKLGDEKAENSFVLAFDYSCIWCHKWMAEILPVIKEKYLDTGKGYYVGQPIVVLDQTSLQLSHVDYFIEKNHPQKLYDLQLLMAQEAVSEGWGTEEYIQTTLKDFGVEVSVQELEKNNPDPISLTRKYTKNLGVEFVPTLYINGIKVYDAFNLDEIEQILNGDIKEDDRIKVPVSEK
ncbi:thioredoxin domain-containing protein [Niallia sp. XMNu-256]|uniref:thioredoxin domain-containing protein n=1 Tax=Niallia sp. XMNu-256 TaxID=3082444 RepID=UPI0030D2E761